MAKKNIQPVRTKKGPIARVNALLKAAGRPERVIRGHGYLYFIGGGADVFLGSIYTMNLENTEEDFEHLRSEVNACFERYDLNRNYGKRLNVKI